MHDPLGYSLRLLKNRLRSAWEIDQALLRRGVEEGDRAAVLQQLQESGLVNDRRFAEAWVHTRDALAPRGEYVLRQELVKKGIDRDLITAVLVARRQDMDEQASDQKTEEELAKELVERKSGAYAHLDPPTRERRLMSLLMRRGFSYEIAKRILKV